jgi:3-hydroxybutyryl-CoA dehydrogenase
MLSGNINHIGILGFGKMGSDIFNYIAEYDFNITVLCINQSEKDKAEKTFIRKLERKLRSEIIDQSFYDVKRMSIIFSENKHDLKSCDLLIECITEDLAVKTAMFAELDEIVDDNCIFASNSSSIIPSLLIDSEKRRDKIVGLHFFYPVLLKNISELIQTENTSTATLENLTNFLSTINRTFILLDEINAFILNRLLIGFQAEAYNIAIEKNVNYRAIDEIVKERLFPVGVFEFFDNVGIDVMYASYKNYIELETEKDPYLPLLEKFADLLSNGSLGVKNKKGFYNYESIEPDADILSMDEQLKESITNRLMFRYITSCANLVKNKIVDIETLDYAVKEFMSVEKGPFTIASENNINLSL